MLNHITIMGRLTRNPEIRHTGSGVTVVSFTVAVDRDRATAGNERETDFVDCVAWRQTGEFVGKYFAKGSMIVVSGRLQIRSFTDQGGNKRRTAEVVADNVYFGDSKRRVGPGGQENRNDTNDTTGNYGASEGYGEPGGYTPEDFAMMDDDGAQLPF